MNLSFIKLHCINRFPFPFQVFLQQAEQLGLRKKLLTGGITEFKYEDRLSYEGSDDPTTFFTSGERQSMILEMVNELRAVQGDELGKIKFVEGQQIGMKTMSMTVPFHENINMQFAFHPIQRWAWSLIWEVEMTTIRLLLYFKIYKKKFSRNPFICGINVGPSCPLRAC